MVTVTDRQQSLDTTENAPFNGLVGEASPCLSCHHSCRLLIIAPIHSGTYTEAFPLHISITVVHNQTKDETKHFKILILWRQKIMMEKEELTIFPSQCSPLRTIDLIEGWTWNICDPLGNCVLQLDDQSSVTTLIVCVLESDHCLAFLAYADLGETAENCFGKRVLMGELCCAVIFFGQCPIWTGFLWKAVLRICPHRCLEPNLMSLTPAL